MLRAVSQPKSFLRQNNMDVCLYPLANVTNSFFLLQFFSLQEVLKVCRKTAVKFRTVEKWKAQIYLTSSLVTSKPAMRSTKYRQESVFQIYSRVMC